MSAFDPKRLRFLPVGVTTAHTEGKTITVLAAASLKNAHVDTAFTKQSGIKVVLRCGASSTLAKQIEQGAAADVFASANLQWVDYGKLTRASICWAISWY
jgi:molybdate transport system substrate-binding protein